MLFPVATMASYPTFMCCHVNGELLYANPDYSDCDGNKVANEVIHKEDPKIKIAIWGDRLRIVFEDNDAFDVCSS